MGVRTAHAYQVSADAPIERPTGKSRPRTAPRIADCSAFAAMRAVKTPKTPAAKRARSETGGRAAASTRRL